MEQSSLGDLVRLLLDPSKAARLPSSSILLRILEATALLLNLAAFYLIIILNKLLLKDRSKGGYGLKGVATLSCFHYSLQARVPVLVACCSSARANQSACERVDFTHRANM
jgi:hypothetical protein